MTFPSLHPIAVAEKRKSHLILCCFQKKNWNPIWMMRARRAKKNVEKNVEIISAERKIKSICLSILVKLSLCRKLSTLTFFNRSTDKNLIFQKLRECHSDEHDNVDGFVGCSRWKGFLISNFPLDSIHLKTWLWNELEQTSEQTTLKLAKKNIAIEKTFHWAQCGWIFHHTKDDWVAGRKNTH